MIIDPVMDFDAGSARTAHAHNEKVQTFCEAQQLAVDYIIETHVHADHLSTAPYLRDQIGGKVAIGSRITQVQHSFGDIYNAEQGGSVRLAACCYCK